MSSFFVDTCVFLAFAYPHEKWNTECTIFFNSEFNMFTGVRVKSEIDRRLQKRSQLYRELAAFFKYNNEPDEFVTNTYMSQNDREHIKQILSILLTKSKTDILTYLRDKDIITKKGIAEAFNKIQKPLVNMSDDLNCEIVIQVLIGNSYDAKIFIDAICWSESGPRSIFATLDWTDFVLNRDQIERAISDYKLIDAGDLSLKIKHIAEIV